MLIISGEICSVPVVIGTKQRTVCFRPQSLDETERKLGEIFNCPGPAQIYVLVGNRQIQAGGVQ